MEGVREAAQGHGLRLRYMVDSGLADWDRYELLQTLAVERWAEEHPEHPDLDEILELRAKEDRLYLRWGREALGFTLLLFRDLRLAPTAVSSRTA
jgi:hypothetical protein